MKLSVITKIKGLFFSIFKSGIGHTMCANIVNKVIGMISTMVITRILSTTDYGIFGYTLNIFSYLTLISGFGLISGNIQFGAENKGRDKAYSYYKYCLTIGLFIDIIIVIVSILVFVNTDLPIDGSNHFIVLYIPILILEYIISITQGILRSKNKIKEYALFLNINTISIALGTCIGALYGIYGVIIGRYIANFVTILSSVVFTKNDIAYIFSAVKLSQKEKKALWNYSIIIGICSALNLLVFSLDITLIAALEKNADEVAIYRVATIIPSALSFIPNSIITAILPNVIYHKDDIIWIKNNIKKLYLYLIVFNLFISLIMIVCAPIIITVVSGSDYVSATQIFQVLIIGYFFSGTFRGLSVNILSAFRRVNFNLLISVITCVADAILNYYLIINFGIIGAAYATVIVDILSGLMSFIYVAVLVKKEIINEHFQKNN